MKRPLLVLVLLVVGVVAATYSVAVAAVVIVAAGLCWGVAHDLRRPSWSEASRTHQDAVYGAAAIAAFHGSGQAGTDCPPGGYDSFGGCGDGGGGGL